MKEFKRIIKKSDEMSEAILKKKFEEAGDLFDTKDAVIIGLYEDFIEKCQALEVLIENGIGASTDMIVRSLIENYTYLKFIFEEDAEVELRANSYYAKTQIDDVNKFVKFISDDEEGENIRKLLNKTKEDLKSLVEYDDPQQKINEIINTFDKVFERRNPESKWYNFDGNYSNFYELTKRLDLVDVYNLLYRNYSGEVHASNVLNRLTVKEGEIGVLINPYDNETHLSITKSFLHETTQKILNYYGMKRELNNYNFLIGYNRRLR